MEENLLSVVMVSDFEAGEEKTWQDEIALVRALAEQDIQQPVEVVLVESESLRSQAVPRVLYDYLPELKLHYCDSEKSSVLKDYGVSVSQGRYIAVLESDCIPSRNWLRLLLAAVSDDKFDIASGRTWYGDETSYRRVLNLLHRSWDDLGYSCESVHISNNGAMYSRAVLTRFPYPDGVTPFVSADERNDRIRKAGYRFYFERTVAMRHAIGGLSFIWDYQRNKGHQRMMTHHRLTCKAVIKLMFLRLKKVFWLSSKFGSEYLRWYDWPLLFLIAPYELVPFTVGMIDALKQVDQIPGSAYR